MKPWLETISLPEWHMLCRFSERNMDQTDEPGMVPLPAWGLQTLVVDAFRFEMRERHP